MSCIHYKFRSSLEYDTITFDGLAISLGDLKKSIMAQKKFAKVTDFDLEVTNAQTKEEYKDESTQIPKNSSVIVRRIPTGTRSKAQLAADRADPYASGIPKTKSDKPELHSSMKQNKIVDLVNSDASEEDKLKAMMSQAGEDWQPNQYVRGRGRGYYPSGPLPPNYVCYRCGKPGHFIRNCPTNGVKRTIGIPRKFGDEAAETGTADDTKKEVKKELSDSTKKLVPVPEGDPSKKERKVPSELKCPMCKSLLTDAVLIPCCGTSYCDECIRTYLLENEQVCPTCGAEDVSPDSLIINKQLRQAVNNFRNARPASPFVNSTTDKVAPSSSTDKPEASSILDKATSAHPVSDSKPKSTGSATPDRSSPDTSEKAKEKEEEKVSSTMSEKTPKDVAEVKENEIKKKEGSPLVFKTGVSSPRKADPACDYEGYHHRPHPRDRPGPRPGAHPGPIPGYHQDHPLHRGPLRGPGPMRQMAEPIMQRGIPPLEGVLLVPSIRAVRPLMPRPQPLLAQPGFIKGPPMGLHPGVCHPNMVGPRMHMEPNLMRAPMPFGVNPTGFRPFDNTMHADGGLQPMSEEEFYRYQKKMKMKTKKTTKDKKSNTRSHPTDFDDELSQYRALQRHRTDTGSGSRSRSQSRSNSRSLSRSLSPSSPSLSKSPTPEDWDRSRTPSPSSPTKIDSKLPSQLEDKKQKHKKRKKHHKHKHSKKQKSTENVVENTKEKNVNEKELVVNKKKTKSKKKSKDKEKSKNKLVKRKSAKEGKSQIKDVETFVQNETTENNQVKKSEKDVASNKTTENIDSTRTVDEKLIKPTTETIVSVEKETKKSELAMETNENEQSKKRKLDDVKAEDESIKTKSTEKSSEKKHKKKKHKKKHKKHKKERGKNPSQSPGDKNASTEETQGDSEEEVGNGKELNVD